MVLSCWIGVARGQITEAGGRRSRHAGAAFPWVIKQAAPLDFNLESRWGISEAPGHIICDAGQRTQHLSHQACTQPSLTPLPLGALISFICSEGWMKDAAWMEQAEALVSSLDSSPAFYIFVRIAKKCHQDKKLKVHADQSASTEFLSYVLFKKDKCFLNKQQDDTGHLGGMSRL